MLTAKLNINQASAREMLLFLIALGVDSPLAEQLAVAICVSRAHPSGRAILMCMDPRNGLN